ncbi:MAG: pilin N-terminal domain-containing protein [Enterococcus raffinosus]
MKMKSLLSLLLICLAGIVLVQPADAAEAQIHLHKRLFVNQEVPSQINQGGALGDTELLKDSYGVNGSTFAIYEIGDYLRDYVMVDKQLSFDQAKRFYRG